MKRCKCCRQIGPRGGYTVRGVEHIGIPYLCPIDGYTYLAIEGLYCAETCQEAKA